MLILDKRKAVERVMALMAAAPAADAGEETPQPHVRTYHRVAIYERRHPAPPLTPARRAERRRRRGDAGRAAINPSPA